MFRVFSPSLNISFFKRIWTSNPFNLLYNFSYTCDLVIKNPSKVTNVQKLFIIRPATEVFSGQDLDFLNQHGSGSSTVSHLGR